ncbi:MAG TPA: YdeI/OmpD-associated family protein [Caulobacteraceae bacterium]|nr:YdeI/OmpD-associated family protein [Caulobacteraceae bacterium]
MKLHATILKTGGNTAGIVVPDAVVTALGAGRRPKVRATIKGYTWRTSIIPMDGQFWVGVSQEVRAGAGVAGGDSVDLELVVDDAPREVEVPADFAAALAANPTERAKFAKLSYSHQRRHVMAIEAAKAPETRARRIEGALKILREG